jgi:hypothetical protein
MMVVEQRRRREHRIVVLQQQLRPEAVLLVIVAAVPAVRRGLIASRSGARACDDGFRRRARGPGAQALGDTAEIVDGALIN